MGGGRYRISTPLLRKGLLKTGQFFAETEHFDQAHTHSEANRGGGGGGRYRISTPLLRKGLLKN